MSNPVLAVADLRVRIGRRDIVQNVGFAVQREQTLGIVGASGCSSFSGRSAFATRRSVSMPIRTSCRAASASG